VALSIKSDEADRLARQLAAETGESLTVAVIEALRARLEQVRRPRRNLARRLLAVSEGAGSLRRLDGRSDDEIIGYDEHGLPR
jgi:antitoxin VapB